VLVNGFDEDSGKLWGLLKKLRDGSRG